MSNIVKRLRAIDHMSVEDCFLQSPLFAQAADIIERLTAELGNARREAQTMRVKPEEKRFVDDEAEILQRLATGDTIVFSMDGDMAWFTKGDHAFVGDAIMSLREKGYLLRKRDVVDDDDDPRGIASYDTISDSGRAAIMALKGERG